ncbi:M61 family metallopeptidase [Roseivirga sp. BDSF3-8]|uniref:M61 family metallopeptidase n=1 Tax=Roseivirga sp. BDSF3-8 TaxID=3241598 RepID=UPI0035319620
MKYTLSYKEPLTHFLTINIELEATEDEEVIDLQLPAWRPGRYQVANFAKNIRDISAKDEYGASLPINKVSKDRWQIHSKSRGKVLLEYEYFAHKMDAGNSWLDDHQVYVNFVNCMLYVPKNEPDPHVLEVIVPDDYKIICALPGRGRGGYHARDFQELADSPVMASRTLREWSYEVGDTVFHLWFEGEHLPDKERTIKAFTDFTVSQVEAMGPLPLQHYHFMFQLLPYKHYHGVEHKACTVITLGPDTKINEEVFYNQFMGVSSHELFHAWNVCRLRPKELLPYDFSREVVFETGFVAEGVTTYYGDLFLARSGFFRASEYFEELNNTLARFGMHDADHHTTLAKSSYDLWLDGYEAGVPDRKVSIYNEGAISALILDLMIRKISSDERSLDDVMRTLYNRFLDTGYTADDYRQVAEEVAGEPLDEFFSDFIYGGMPVKKYLPELLGRMGLALEWVPGEETAYIHRFGFRLGKKEKEMKVAHTAPGSEAERVLSLEDELIAVNGRKLESDEDLNFYTGEISLTLFRNDVLHTVVLSEDSEKFYTYGKIVPKEEASSEELSRMRLWLRGKSDKA